VDRHQHLDVDDPLGRGKETDDQTRALKLIRGLRHDVYEFSRLLAMRAGAIPVIAVYQPWSDADAGYYHRSHKAGDPDRVENFSSMSSFTFSVSMASDVYTKRKLKGIGRRLLILSELLEGDHNLVNPTGVRADYVSIISDMQRYGMDRAMTKYGAFGRYGHNIFIATTTNP